MPLCDSEGLGGKFWDGPEWTGGGFWPIYCGKRRNTSFQWCCYILFIFYIQVNMKQFFVKMSVTKLVFLILTLVLSFQTVYLTVNWIETSLFNNAMLMVISFYFGQKVWESKKDPLLDWDDKNGKD